MDVGSSTRLAQQNLQIPEHASNRFIPDWLFPPRFSARDRLTSSRPDAILVTPVRTKPTTPPSYSSCQVLRNSNRTQQRHNNQATTRLPHQLSIQGRHVQLIEVKFCEDTRPENQLNASKLQHKQLCTNLRGKRITLHTILLGVGGTIYVSHTLKLLRELGLDTQRAAKLAYKLHGHAVQYAHKLSTTRRSLENKNSSYSQVLGSGARNPPDPH
jgi:hypothetical protein